MSDNFDDIDKPINHPLENVFNIEEGTTYVPVKQMKKELVVPSEYDEKDNELDEQFQEVYKTAFEAYEAQAQEAELVEPRFKARNAEVAVQYLNTALQAVKEKANLKQHNDKIKLKERNPSTVNNNLVVSRNDLLKMLEKEDTE